MSVALLAPAPAPQEALQAYLQGTAGPPALFHEHAHTQRLSSLLNSRILTEVSPDQVPTALALKDRLSGRTEDDLSSEQVLEFALQFVKSVVNASVVARALMDRFGTLAGVLAARPARLSRVPGVDEEVVLLLRTIQKVGAHALRAPLENRPIFKNFSQLSDYLRATLGGEEEEVVRILLLDKKNQLIRDELHARGTVGQVAVYPREIVRRVIEVNATALIIVHNHPSGNLTPSPQDIEQTEQLTEVLAAVGCTLHDSIIVGHQQCSSLRQLGHFRSSTR